MALKLSGTDPEVSPHFTLLPHMHTQLVLLEAELPSMAGAAADSAEENGQAQCCIRRDRPLARADRRDVRFGDADFPCQAVLRDAERNPKFLAQHVTGMGVV